MSGTSGLVGARLGSWRARLRKVFAGAIVVAGFCLLYGAGLLSDSWRLIVVDMVVGVILVLLGVVLYLVRPNPG
jgi:hypothetical protein